MKRGFTLIEIIVVIIIVGILAAVGITQYSKTVERGRAAEARTILGFTRKLAYEYYLANGTLTGITDADLSVGGASSPIPSSCRSTHYFHYSIRGAVTDSVIEVGAWRCLTGGKTPQGDPSWTCIELALKSDFSTGNDCWTVHSCGSCTP